MRFTGLSEWLDWIKSLHTKQIDLGLDRVKRVAEGMHLLNFSFPVITVAGTNGKGSTVAGLETIYREAGYCVGAFTSPYLFRFNEQFRLEGKEVTDQMLCDAFQAVENAREGISLTPFEFNTLAALKIFKDERLDLVILEVGLGGRLDAVNIVDADIAVVTSIDIDHQEWLGNTREEIALEKAGIFRSHKPAVYGDRDPPRTLIDYAKKISVPLYCQGLQFAYETDGFQWNWWSEKNRYENLPLPSLLLQNMSVVLMVVELLQPALPVNKTVIEKALQQVSLIGRIQVVAGEVPHIYDVSHNPASVAQLDQYLKGHKSMGKTLAVFSMLRDKDISSTISSIKEEIDEWYVAPLHNERGTTMDELTQYFLKANVENVHWFEDIATAHQFAQKQAHQGDQIIVFGSFHTVAEVLSDEQAR